MKTLATIFGALALMTWGASAQEGPVPATAADAQPALAAPAATPAVEVQPAAEIQPAAPAAEATVYKRNILFNHTGDVSGAGSPDNPGKYKSY